MYIESIYSYSLVHQYFLRSFMVSLKAVDPNNFWVKTYLVSSNGELLIV